MSIIVIRGFKNTMSMEKLYYYLKPIIKGNFKTLEMVKVKEYKICFVELSKGLDPNKVIQEIESSNKSGHMHIYAYIPGPKNALNDILPDVKKARKHALSTLTGLQRELQFKYNKLFSLTDGHKYLDAVMEIIVERLRYLIASGRSLHPLKLTKQYRMSYPHNTDLAMLQTVYDKVHGELGKPQSVLVEEDIMHVAKDPEPKTYPFNKVMKTAMRFTRDITQKVETYIQSLPSEEDDNANITKEEMVRVKVRHELKNLAPYLNLMIPQIVNKQWTLQNEEECKIRVSGEPDIPRQHVLLNLFRKFHINSYVMCPVMYNTVLFKAHASDLHEILHMDGTIIDGAKLTIRQRRIHMHYGNPAIANKLIELVSAMPSI